MTRVRVYTENVNYQATIDLAKRHFPKGFNVTTAKGYWADTTENSLIVEVLTADHEIDSAVSAFCFDVNRDNRQECCMVTRETVDCFTL